MILNERFIVDEEGNRVSVVLEKNGSIRVYQCRNYE